MKKWQGREFSSLRKYTGELVQALPSSVQKSSRDSGHLSFWEPAPYAKVVHQGSMDLAFIPVWSLQYHVSQHYV